MIREAAFGAGEHTGGTDVHEALDASAPGSLEAAFGKFHIGRQHFSGGAAAELIRASQMKHDVHAPAIVNDLNRSSKKSLCFLARADEDADLRAVGQESAHDIPADETRSACNQTLRAREHCGSI